MLKKVLKSLQVRRKYLFNQDAARAMFENFKELDLTPSQEVVIAGRKFRQATFEGRLEVISEYPTQFEKQLFGTTAQELGMQKVDVRLMMNLVTRYLYPHAGIGHQTLKWPLVERGYFHPQHLSYAQEEEGFSDKLKDEIRETFLPLEGWSVLDVGAYLGLGTLKLSELVGPEGQVVSVEAKRENFEVLEKHLSLNHVKTVQPLFGAIWHESGVEMNFNVSRRQANALDSELIEGKSQTVRTVSLPDLSDKVKGRVNLVSLTVNGAEVEAIEGLRNLDSVDLPERILSPGWYAQGKTPRWSLLSEALKKLGYRVEVTKKGFVFAWLP